MSIPLCGHLKQDGVPCGSPALHGKKLCYFHLREHKRSQYAAAVIRRADVLGPKLPPMKSLADILQRSTRSATQSSTIASQPVAQVSSFSVCSRPRYPYAHRTGPRASHATPYGSIFCL